MFVRILMTDTTSPNPETDLICVTSGEIRGGAAARLRRSLEAVFLDYITSVELETIRTAEAAREFLFRGSLETCTAAILRGAKAVQREAERNATPAPTGTRPIDGAASGSPHEHTLRSMLAAYEAEALRLEIQTALKNRELDQFPGAFDDDIRSLRKWLAACVANPETVAFQFNPPSVLKTDFEARLAGETPANAPPRRERP